MARQMRVRELLVGVEGLALLRGLYDGSEDDTQRRLTEVRRLLDDEAYSIEEPTSETDPRTGYGSWAENYDAGDNPVIALEEAIVWGILGEMTPARALDAACGTGRHARRLVELGHEVVGIDLTVEMLRRAEASVPDAAFVEADLRDIPAEDEEFDVVVCGLALAHLRDFQPAVAELGRVLKPGGRLIVSVLHPFQALLGWQAPFADARGRRAFVREHPHTHAEYLAAFMAAGLRLRNCVEPRLTEVLLRSKRRAYRHIPEATVAAYAGLPAVLVWDLQKE